MSETGGTNECELSSLLLFFIQEVLQVHFLKESKAVSDNTLKMTELRKGLSFFIFSNILQTQKRDGLRVAERETNVSENTNRKKKRTENRREEK